MSTNRPFTLPFSNMARRLKYFPKKLEETVSHLLTYINKFGDNMGKLGLACGLFAASGLISLSVLTSIFKDHLVNDGKMLVAILLFCNRVNSSKSLAMQ